MKKLGIFIPLLLVGCLQTTTHKIEMKRKSGDIWWRDPVVAPVNSCSVAPVSTPVLTDEEYFEKRVIRWPDSWQPTPQKKTQTDAPESLPEVQPEGELY